MEAQTGRPAWTGYSIAAATLVAALVFPAPIGSTAPGFASATEASLRDEPLRPVPRTVALDARKVALGARLFADPQLSGDGSVACASCHVLAEGGDDGVPRSIGIGGSVVAVNAPTVLNAALNFRQFWDGRAATLEEQIDGPMLAAAEMGSSWEHVVALLSKSPSYATAFSQLYANGVTPANVRDAIAEFERSLITPDSRFDRYLRGDEAVLTETERSGYRKFKEYGCVSCHQGVNVGGNMYQRMGVMGDYFADRGNPTDADLGRYNVTGDEADRYTFKVPSLRNVERTAPYFHDGSTATLEQAVAVMARYQLGRPLPPDDLDQIVSFLKTLTAQPSEVSQ